MPSTKLAKGIAKFLLSFCGLASFGVVTTLIALSTNNVYAESSSNTITANLPGSVAIRLLDSTGTTEISSLDFNNLTPTPQGTTASKSFIVDVATSNPTGYKLYMQSDYQDSNNNYTTNLTHTDADVTDNIPTLVPGSGSSADTKVYWNYVNPLTSTTSPIPAYGQPDKIGQYFTATASNQSTIGINVGIDTTIVSGIYENELLFSAVGNPTMVEYKVTFDPAGGTQSETEIEETAAAGTHSITIPNSSEYIPTKTNYLFDYWQISIPTGSQIVATCNNTNICHPGDNIVISSDEEFKGNVTLNAVYKQDITVISKMQDMTAEICENTAIGTSATLEDTRDNNTYTVKRLNDGNCWMTQNQKLVGPFTPTSNDSDVSDSSTFTLTASTSASDAWCTEVSSACIDKSMVVLDTVTTPYKESFGTYYNWYAATAGTGTYELETGSATNSICPKGWRLPLGGPTGEFQILYNKYPSLNDMTSDNGPHYEYSGYRGGPTSYQRGDVGQFWSSTVVSKIDIYNLSFSISKGEIKPAYDQNFKAYGRPIRCLAKNMSGTLTVDPNGGTWEGDVEPQNFTQGSGTAKIIEDPVGPAYTVNFDDNNHNATFDNSTILVTQKFNRWIPSGFGIIAYDAENGNKYTFGAGEGTLTAEYSPISDKINLPTITKPGYTCGWTANNTSYASGQTDVTVTEDTTFVAECTSPAFNGITKMQEMTPEICVSNAIGTTKTLTDIRDNKTYTVKRLNDGNCWMTQNLRLVGSVELNSSNSDVAESFTLPASTSEDFNAIGELRFLDSGNINYGVYYNFYTATAKSYTKDIPGDAPYSICPKGWKLPSTGFNEYNMLAAYYPVDTTGINGNKMITSDPALSLSGVRIRTNTTEQGERGYYWIGHGFRSRSYAYALYIDNSANQFTGWGNTERGMAVRCYADTSGIVGGLTVDPNGGTWNGSTEKQTFTQESGTTKALSNPTSNPNTYTITYDDNGQGATFSSSPTSVPTAFTGWAISGGGALSGGTYKFGSGSATVVAQYGLKGSASKVFALPAITKEGHYCTWREGSPSGIELFSGQTNMTVTRDTTYYASCTARAFNGITTMQQMTPAICSAATIGDRTTLRDTRDDNTYNIQKLNDGKCWMVQDLALIAPTSGKLTSSDSDVNSDVTWGTNVKNCVSANDWCVNYDNTIPEYGYGAHYNYYVATAKSGPVTNDAAQSICPKGWKLPSTNGSKTDVQLLYNKYNSFEALTRPGGPDLRPSGYAEYDNPWGGRYANFYYLSSTAYSDYLTYQFWGSRNTISPASYNNYGTKGSRKNGYSVRCVAEGYDVNISNSNTTSSVSKINVSYGGSVAITVTPNSNYYLSSVSCPSGYTCSGYTTGTSATGTQTVTITNNDTKNSGTVTFTASPDLKQSCANAATGATFTYDNVQYIKLKTDSAGTNTACYTKSSRGTGTFTNASSLCPTGTSVPTQADYTSLINAYGSSGLNTATGWGPTTSYTRYWSSTAYPSAAGYGYYLRVWTTGASVTAATSTTQYNILCKIN